MGKATILLTALAIPLMARGQTTTTVVSLTLTSPDTVEVGDTVTLTATGRNAAGAVVSPVAFTWGAIGAKLLTTTGSPTRAVATSPTILVGVVARGLVATATITAVPPDPVQRPRVVPTPTMPPITGRTLTVTTDLQAALDSARGGDVVEVTGDWVGNFTLPARPSNDTGWVILRPPTQLADGRVDTTTTLPTLSTPNGLPVIHTAPGAHHWRLVGLDIRATPSVTQTNVIVSLGTTDTTALAHHLVLDRVRITGHDSLHTKRCVALNSGWTAVVDSRLRGCHADGQDSQAIGGWNGPGPYLIANNDLADASEVIMFGGSDPTRPGVIPSDITITGNHLHNTPVMRSRWLVKNLLELKAARRVRIAGNVIESVWPAGQKGFALSLKSVNQSGGCTWCLVRDVAIVGNWISDASGGIQLAAVDNAGFPPAEYLNHVRIRGNVFLRLGIDPTMVGWAIYNLNQVSDIWVEDNAWESTNAAIAVEGTPTARWTITGNTFSATTYGVKGSGALAGTATFAKYFPDATVAGNAFVGVNPLAYPTGNTAPPTFTLSLTQQALIERLRGIW